MSMTTAHTLLTTLGVPEAAFTGGHLAARSPIDGSTTGAVHEATPEQVQAAIAHAHRAFVVWRQVPAPRRGELVRLFGEALRRHKATLAALVTLEAGKVSSEGAGEVQEMIDICDFAVGLSRQLHGLATQALFESALAQYRADGGDAPDHLSQVLIGRAAVGEALVDDPRVALVSATGSTRMGRAVGPRVAARFGRCLLELGGNNAIIVAPSADLDLAVHGILFGAYGTAGQRCTTTRRVIAHDSIHDGAFDAMQAALAQAADQGGQVRGGERVMVGGHASAFYAAPALVTMPEQTTVVCHETFAPILYVLKYAAFDEASTRHNGVPQGRSSAIFTNDLREAEAFLAASGSDCGIANVNIGTSGAEIGGAFGGEKETGGGRESGSDAWKNYMRRATNTVNYSRALPLAQGVRFDI